ncbi:MAG TPA: HAMP domain-containing sensor histidine kinase [bacterium]|nr:HAMP domain-containing sensor histidine kinase [bacterium]
MFEPVSISALIYTLLTVGLALAWRIVAAGKRTPDGIFAFLFLLSLALLYSVASVGYFPFFLPFFFFALILCQSTAAFYVYAFPNAVRPPTRWLVFIAASDALFLLFFLLDPAFAFPAVVLSSTHLAALSLLFTLRKQRHLRPAVRAGANRTITAIILIQLLLGATTAAGIRLFMTTPFLAAVPIVILATAFLLVSSRRISRDIPLSRSFVFPLFFLSIPLGFVWYELFPLRAMLARHFESGAFPTNAAIAAFLTLNLFAIMAALIADRIPRYIGIYQARHDLFTASFRTRAAAATTHRELLRLFNTTLTSSFPEIRDLRYILFSEDDDHLPEAGLLRTCDPRLEEGLIVEWFSDGSEDHLLRRAAPSGLLEEECDRIGADLVIPLRDRGMLFGVLAISGKAINASVARTIATIASTAADHYLRLSLLSVILHKERQIRETEYFAETGNMVSLIAHEIRTPLTSVMLNLEVLKESLQKEGPIDPEYLDIAHREVKRLNETVEKMLLFGRNIKLESSDGSFDDLIADLRRTYAAVPVRFGASPTGAFRLDWDRLRYLLINLINNALQAIERSGRPGEVTVTVRKEDHRILLEVSDTGPGIPEEVGDRIFDPFFTTRKEGNGLGLAICRKIARLMEGTIELTVSRPGETRFTLTIPTEK